jgi:hypothetical protein
LGVKKPEKNSSQDSAGKGGVGVQDIIGSKDSIRQTLLTQSPEGKGKKRRKPRLKWHFPVNNSDLNEVKLGRPARECLHEYDEMLIAHMACGYSFESFGARIHACEELLYDWIEKHEHFKSAKKVGRVFCLFFWEKQGIEGLPKGKDFNTGTWVFNMANRFGWRHVQAVVNDKGEPLPVNPFEMLAQAIAKDSRMKNTLTTLLAANKIELSEKEEAVVEVKPTNGKNGNGNGSQ